MNPPNPSSGPALEGGFRTEAERLAGARLKEIFDRCPDPFEKKIEAFPKYVKRQNITRLLAQYEIFKRILPVKGSIVECGVFRGATLMGWAHLSAMLEPVNLTRRIYGFDTFEGFPSVSEKDRAAQTAQVAPGALYSNSHDELTEILQVYDSTRFLGHIQKVQLVKGDAAKTIPEFVAQNQQLVISLLFLDFDLYEPTKIALEQFVPRMPKGAVLAFDELDNPLWPGETRAMLEHCAGRRLPLQRLEFDPYIGFAVLD
jgi:hypothetical protein